jgi:hypothetical protein
MVTSDPFWRPQRPGQPTRAQILPELGGRAIGERHPAIRDTLPLGPSPGPP